MKLCKDCVFCVPDRSFVFWWSAARMRYAKCSRQIDPVDGSPAMYCSSERTTLHGLADHCGRDGKFFTPKAQSEAA